MKRIGLLIERHWHYGRRICEGISAFAREHGGLTLEFLELNDLGNRAKLERFDGFIARVWSRRIDAAFAATGRPTVDVYGESDGLHAVLVDQNARLIAELAARHFIEHRFSHFAFCGYARQKYSIQRRDAFVHTLGLNHYACDVFEDRTFSPAMFGRKILGRGSYDARIDPRALAKWLERLPKPVAVFCAHDLVALNLVKVCRARNIAIPSEVAVLGVDDDPLVCDFASPTVSSIDPNPFGIGREAARCVTEWMERPGIRPDGSRPAPLGLTERDSTRVYAFREQWLTDALVFIRRNIARNINAGDVFAHLGLSHTTVERGFSAKLGTTVNRVIARVRIEEAKRLLTHTTLPLSAVRSQSGFSSAAYFTAVFRRATGFTPLDWRRLADGDAPPCLAGARPSRHVKTLSARWRNADDRIRIGKQGR